MMLTGNSDGELQIMYVHGFQLPAITTADTNTKYMFKALRYVEDKKSCSFWKPQHKFKS